MATALQHMKYALGILDEAGAPPEIGANLDLAISRLEDALSTDVGFDEDEAG